MTGAGRGAGRGAGAQRGEGSIDGSINQSINPWVGRGELGEGRTEIKALDRWREGLINTEIRRINQPTEGLKVNKSTRKEIKGR